MNRNDALAVGGGIVFLAFAATTIDMTAREKSNAALAVAGAQFTSDTQSAWLTGTHEGLGVVSVFGCAKMLAFWGVRSVLHAAVFLPLEQTAGSLRSGAVL